MTLTTSMPREPNFAAGSPPANGTTSGTFLVKSLGSNYPVAIIGSRWAGGGTATNLTSDAVRRSKSVTVASTAGLTVGQLVVINETTDPNLSHWERGAETTGWFSEVNRPLGDTMEIASISGNTVTFTTDFPIIPDHLSGVAVGPPMSREQSNKLLGY
jgi:hypothetical protein